MTDSSTPAQPDPRIDTLIAGKYRLCRVLGAGGMGTVFEAENTWTRRRVAIKLLLPEFAQREDVVARFLQEARAAAQVRHKNIIDVLDMGRDGPSGPLYIVQELLSGQDLRARIDRGGALSLGEAVSVLGPILSALEAAHAAGIIHRDLKPENIFLSRAQDGEVTPKLIDFGVAKVLDLEPGVPLHKTKTGTALGTPYYMSPEQARGDVAVDARSDLWSMGAVLFELVTGRRPFEATTFTLLVVKILTERAPRADAVDPRVDPALADVIARALESDRDKRFSSASEMRAALTAVASGAVGVRPAPVSVDPTSRDDTSTPAPVTTTIEPQSVRPNTFVTADTMLAQPPKRPRPWVVVSLAASVSAVLALGVLSGIKGSLRSGNAAVASAPNATSRAASNGASTVTPSQPVVIADAGASATESVVDASVAASAHESVADAASAALDHDEHRGGSVTRGTRPRSADAGSAGRADARATAPTGAPTRVGVQPGDDLRPRNEYGP